MTGSALTARHSLTHSLTLQVAALTGCHHEELLEVVGQQWKWQRVEAAEAQHAERARGVVQHRHARVAHRVSDGVSDGVGEYLGS